MSIVRFYWGGSLADTVKPLLTVLANMEKLSAVYLDKTTEALAEVNAALREIQERRRWNG